MLRILLNDRGTFTLETRPLASSLPTRRVVLAKEPLSSKNEFLAYKTTYAPWYTADRREIAAGKVFDVLHYNTEGHLTEGARSNIVLDLGGKLYTPPLSCGLLGGIGRADLIRRGICSERLLTLDDLRRARHVYCVNSVRGLLEVTLAPPPNRPKVELSVEHS